MNEELEALKTFLKTLGVEEFPFEDVVLVRKKYYLTTEKTRGLLGKIPEDALREGLFLGSFKKQFEASMPLLRLISSKARSIVLDEKTSWLFSCGRDIFAKQVPQDSELKKGSFVVVKNNEGDVLGLALKLVSKKETLYKNILDVGDYLRREKKKR